jgi:hypothetical protein
MPSRGRTPQEFLDAVRAANGPTKRQREAHEREMEPVRARIAARKTEKEK